MESSDQVTDRGTPRDETARLMRLATYASVAVASSLILVKLAAWLHTEAISLLSTLIDSLPIGQEMLRIQPAGSDRSIHDEIQSRLDILERG